MSFRRPGLRSVIYMSLLAAGIVVMVGLIFRGAAAPEEPARAVLPGAANLTLPGAGRYLVLDELVVRPQPARKGKEPAPDLEVVLTPLLKGRVTGREVRAGDVRGAPIPIEEPSWLDWLVKVMVGGHGKTAGHFRIEEPGAYRVEGVEKDPGAGAGSCVVVRAFVRTASPGRFLWLALGFGGQICFSTRFLIQWLASERAGRSTVPRAFWYYSLVGGLMVLAYAAYTRDPVFIGAYVFSSFIYVRNLILLDREERAAGNGGA